MAVYWDWTSSLHTTDSKCGFKSFGNNCNTFTCTIVWMLFRVVERQLLVRSVVGSIPYDGLFELFSFQKERK